MTEGAPTYEQLQEQLAEASRRLAEAEHAIAVLKRQVPSEQQVKRQHAAWISERILKSVMDYIPEGVTIADRDTETIIMESRYGFYLEGKIPSDEEVPLREGLRNMHMARVEDLSPAVVEELPLWRATMLGETINDEEWVLLKEDRDPIILLINAGPISDPVGKITGGVAAWRDITERKTTANTIRESAELFSSILNNLPVGVFILEKTGRIKYANPAAERIWGRIAYVDMEDYGVYQAWWADTGDPVAPEQWAAVQALTKGETRMHERIRIMSFDGQSRYTLSSALPTYDHHDQVNGAIVVMEDITCLYEAEQALRQSEQQYRELVQTAAVLILRIDMNCNIMFLNEHAKTIFGYGDDVIGQSAVELFNISGLLPPETIKDNLREESALYIETEHTAKKGKRLWVGWNLRAIREADGSIREVLAVGLDITKRKEAEDKIRQSEARFRVLTDALPNLVWTILPDGTVEYVNRRWLDYMAIPFEQAENWMQRLHPDDRKRTLEVWDHALRTGDFYQIQYRLRGPDGQYRWHLNLAVPLRDEDGRIFRWFGTSTDIHDQKQAEQDLQRIATELERSNKELEDFAYVASHDLQEPLRMITGYLQLLERRYKDKLDADAHTFIDYAVDGATRMQRLIVDLLAYSRVGTRGAALVPTDLAAALERAKADLGSLISETSATITNDPLPIVRGDETQLAQLFLNLIGNAIKFRSEKLPEIHIGVQKHGDGYLISVRDNGIGIDPRYSARIFQLFQRLHTRQKYAGTGIGLAICKKIIDRHGGRIWVESEPTKGSTFFFTLPAGDQSWT